MDYMTNLLENDSEHGRWKLPDLKVKDEKTIFYRDKAVTVTGIRSSEGIPWAESKSDYVVDTIGVSSDKDKDAAHSKDGDNKVVISALGKDVHLFVEGIRTTGNSITAAQRTVNGPSVDDWIVRRDASFNIIPTNIGTAKAVWKETEAELKEILGFRKDDLFMQSMGEFGILNCLMV